jgi:hypothetical protein
MPVARIPFTQAGKTNHKHLVENVEMMSRGLMTSDLAATFVSSLVAPGIKQHPF